MLIHPTVERLRALGLTAMADAFIELQNSPDAGELSREDWLGLLVDRAATSPEHTRCPRRPRPAQPRDQAAPPPPAPGPAAPVGRRRGRRLPRPPRPRPRSLPQTRELRMGP